MTESHLAFPSYLIFIAVSLIKYVESQIFK